MALQLKKVVLESVCGLEIRDSQQLTLLSEVLGIRKKTMFEMAKQRTLMEENQELAMLVEKLGRKPPEGEKYISPEWKLEAGHFYEDKSVLVKGHHAIYKVCLNLTDLSCFVATYKLLVGYIVSCWLSIL